MQAEKRYRELLAAQRDRFLDYLNVLDKQKPLIQKGDADAILHLVALEEQCLADIVAIQAVLGAEGRAVNPTDPVMQEIEELRRDAAAQSAQNQELLSKRMESIAADIRRLRASPFKSRQSIYANRGAASLVDIEG